MGDGRTLAEHWPLVVLIGATFGGVFMFVRALMGALDSRSDERLHLFFSNGGGELLQEKMKAAVLEALNEHQTCCPHAARVQAIEQRLITLERAQ